MWIYIMKHSYIPVAMNFVYGLAIFGFVSSNFGVPKFENVSVALMILLTAASVLISICLVLMVAQHGHSMENMHQKFQEAGSFKEKKNLLKRIFDKVVLCVLVGLAAYSGYVALAVFYVLGNVLLRLAYSLLKKYHEDWLETQEAMNTWRSKNGLN